MKKNYGVTLVELGIIIAILSIISIGGVVFFRHTFEVWWTSRDVIDVHAGAREAMDEMSTFLRQASTDTIKIEGNDKIKFTIAKSEQEWGHPDRRLNYFLDSGSLKRYSRGSTTTLVGGGVSFFNITHTTAAARFESVKVELEILKGEEQSSFSRNIVLRGRLSE